MTWLSFQNSSEFSPCGKQGDSKYSSTIKVISLGVIIELEDAVSLIKSLKMSLFSWLGALDFTPDIQLVKTCKFSLVLVFIGLISKDKVNAEGLQN